MTDLVLGDDDDDGEAAVMEDSDLENEEDEVAVFFLFKESINIYFLCYFQAEVKTVSDREHVALKTSDSVGEIIQTRTYDLNITYDKYYQTPRLWVSGHDEVLSLTLLTLAIN